MRAMILAAGRGERMRPLTDTTPKPLLPVGGKPLIVWHIERLKKAGIDEIVINLAYLGEKIEAYLGDGSRYGVKIAYSYEGEKGGLETLGGIVNALSLLGNDPFWVVNGDIFTDYPMASDVLLPEDCDAHLVVVPNPPHHPYGDFDVCEGKLYDRPRYTFAGIGLYRPALFKGIGVQKAPLAPLLRQAMAQKRVCGEVYHGVWIDVGTPQRLKQADTTAYANSLLT